VNPLEKARESAGRAWTRSKQGTTRTSGWVKDGVSGAVGKARGGLSGLRTGATGGDSKPTGGAGDGAPGIWERTGGATLVERARSDHRVAIAWAAGAFLLLAWIAWTIYVWAENGSTAGLGVLITWPAVFLVAGIIAAPFVGAGVLVHRHRLAADGAPAIEGGGGAATETKDETESKDEKATEDKSDGSSDDEGPGEDEAKDSDEAEGDSGEDEDSAEDDAPKDEDSAEDDAPKDEDSGEESDAA
jgi:hypothetical protein